MSTKQQFIDDVLNSLDGISGAEAPSFLYEKVAFRLKNKTGDIYIPRTRILLQAACVAALLLFNIAVCIHFVHTKSSGSTNTIGQEYFSYVNDYNI